MRKNLLFTIALFLIAYLLKAQTPVISYTIPDIGAPGMNSSIEIIAPINLNGAFGTDGFHWNGNNDNIRILLANISDTNKIKISPIVVSWNGKVISAQFFVNPKLIPNSYNWSFLRPEFRIPFYVQVNGKNSNIDTFYIVRPFNFGDKTANSERILGQGSLGIRSRRGAMIVNSMILADTTYTVSRNDPDPYKPGNQAYLPFVLIVEGSLSGKTNTAISVSGGFEGGANDIRHAGPGGGGGGGSFFDARTPADPNLGTTGGNGFVSGGKGGRNRSGIPGATDAFTTYGESSGLDGYSLNGVAPSLANSYESSGGGTGHPFGTSGESCPVGNNCILPGGYGGGSGFEQNKEGGSGGYASRGSSTDSQNKNGGQIHGNYMTVPLAGGSGGASGNPNDLLIRLSGSGGGGGGAIRVFAPTVKDLNLTANGSIGGLPAQQSRGGHGSGGHTALQFKMLNDNYYKLSAIGGKYQTTSGGAGRVRYDGPGNLSAVFDIPAENKGFTYRGPSTDTTHFISSKQIKITGGKYEGNSIRAFLKPESDVWRELTGLISSGFSWEIDINLPGNDTLYYFYAMQDVDTPEKTNFLYEPDFVYSQAAANVIIIEAFPEIITGSPYRDTILDCCDGETIDFAFDIENIGRADVFLLNNIHKFTKGNQGFQLITPQSNVNLRSKTKQNYIVRYTHNKGSRGIIRDTLEIPTNPDKWGPVKIAFEIIIDTLDLKSVEPLGLIEKDTFFMGTICSGKKISDTIAIENLSSLTVTLKNTSSINPDFIPKILGKRVIGVSPISTDTANIQVDFDSKNLPAGRYQSLIYVSIEECGCPPSIDSFWVQVEVVEANLSLEGQLDFGSVRMGQSKSGNIYLVNRGKGNAQINTIPVLTTAFKILSTNPNLPVLLAPGDTITLFVEFKPVIKGLDSSEITFSSVETGNSCPDIVLDTLRGKGVDVTVEVLPREIDFGIRVHCDVTEDTIRVSNPPENNLPFTITRHWIEGAGAASFSFAYEPAVPVVVNPGTHVDYHVKYDPSVMPFGLKQANFIIATDEISMPFDTVLLKGTNEDFLIDISLPLPYDFGPIAVGEVVSAPFTITNNGFNDRNINNIITDNADINVAPLVSFLPGNGGTGNYQLVARLTKPGQTNVNLKIVSYQPKCSDTLEFQVKALGIEGIVELPDTLDFGILAPCEEKIDSIKISNKGDAPFTILSVNLSSPSSNFEILPSINLPDTLKKDDLRYIKVKFSASPGNDGMIIEELIIKVFEDGEEKTYKAVLKGERKSGFLSTPQSLNFGSVIINNNKTLKIEISNSGLWDIDIVSTQGPFNTSAFELISSRPDGTTLTGAGKQNFDFIFHPLAEGIYRDSIIFALNINSCPDTAYVILTGEGASGVEVTVLLPDTLIPPTLDNFGYPIMVKFNNNGVILNDTVSMILTIKFNPSLFYPIDVSQGYIISRNLMNNQMTLKVQSPNLPINTSGGELMKIMGYTMLGDSKSTPMKIDTVEFSNNKAISRFEKKDGSLNLIICEDGGDRLLKAQNTFSMVIKPNPANDDFDIEISAFEKGIHRMEIYNIQGTKIYERSFNAENGKIYKIDVDSVNFASGVYNVVLKSPVRMTSKTLFIIK